MTTLTQPMATIEAAVVEAIHRGQVLPGMSFQQKAWALCSRIPAGRVSTYAELARALGSPGAARAVGNAMRCNPYAPQVPCHRVVGSDGRLTGYAFGLERKAELLHKEGITIRNGRADVDQIYHFATAQLS